MTSPVHNEPCIHVKRYVERVATGRPIRWWNIFGRLHIQRCPKCQRALSMLQAYLKSVAEVGQEANLDTSILFSRMSEAMSEVDRQQKHSNN